MHVYFNVFVCEVYTVVIYVWYIGEGHVLCLALIKREEKSFVGFTHARWIVGTLHELH